MHYNGLEYVLKETKKVLYTDLLVMSCQVLAIITCLIFIKKEKFAFRFLIYCCSALLLFLFFRVSPLLTNQVPRTRSIETGNVAFALIEFLIFYSFFKMVLLSTYAKKFMFITRILVIAACLFFFVEVFVIKISREMIVRLSDFVITPELFLLGCFSMIYYAQLFGEKNVGNISKRPSFWIVTGLFFYSLVIAPFFLVISDNFIDTHPTIFWGLSTVHYTSFAFLFLAITKAFLCKKPLTT